jgi:hypothetical protein
MYQLLTLFIYLEEKVKHAVADDTWNPRRSYVMSKYTSYDLDQNNRLEAQKIKDP